MANFFDDPPPGAIAPSGSAPPKTSGNFFDDPPTAAAPAPPAPQFSSYWQHGAKAAGLPPSITNFVQSAGTKITESGVGFGQLAAHILNTVGQGSPATAAIQAHMDQQAQNLQNYDQQQQQSGQASYWGGLAGELASPVNYIPGEKLIPGVTDAIKAGKLIGSMAEGARFGALTGASKPVANTTDYGKTKAEDIGLDAAINGLTAGALGLPGAAIKTWVRPDAQRFIDMGVKLTPGQAAGGIRNAVEQKLAGTIPFLGDQISDRRADAVKDLNTAIMNDVLAPLGEKLTGEVKYGNEAVKETGDKVSESYNKMLDDPNLKFVMTPQFVKDVDSIKRDIATLPPDHQAQLKNILNEALNPNIKGIPSGRQMKDALTDLGKQYARYSTQGSGADRHMAEIIQDYMGAMKDNLSASNPQAAAQLKILDDAWAKLVRIENAAKRRAGSGGVFSGMDLLSAIRSGSSTVRQRGFARGTELMQNIAKAAHEVFGNTVPDSGTAGRAATERIITHPFQTGAAGAAGVAASPFVVPAGIAASALYSKTGNKLLNAAFADPSLRQSLGLGAQKAGQSAAGPISDIVTSGQNNQ